MKWASTLISESSDQFSKFHSSKPSYEKQATRNSGDFSKQKLTAKNTGIVLVPNDIQKEACKILCNKIQEFINNKILKNIPGQPRYKSSKAVSYSD